MGVTPDVKTQQVQPFLHGCEPDVLFQGPALVRVASAQPDLPPCSHGWFRSFMARHDIVAAAPAVPQLVQLYCTSWLS